MGKPSPQMRDGRKPGWFYIDGALIERYGPTIGAYGIAVYAALAHKAALTRSEHAIIGYDALAAQIGVGRNTVIRTLRDLEAAGVINIEPQTDENDRPIGANIYTLCAVTDQDSPNHEGGVPTQGTGYPHRVPPMPTQGTGGYPHRVPGVPTQACDSNKYHIERDHESPTPTCDEPQKVVGDGGGDDQTFLCELIERGLNPTTAQGIAQAQAENHETVLQSLDNMLADGEVAKRERDATIGQFVNRLKMAPPAPGKPYARTRKAPARASPSAPLIATQPHLADPAEASAAIQKALAERTRPDAVPRTTDEPGSGARNPWRTPQ